MRAFCSQNYILSSLYSPWSSNEAAFGQSILSVSASTSCRLQIEPRILMCHPGKQCNHTFSLFCFKHTYSMRLRFLWFTPNRSDPFFYTSSTFKVAKSVSSSTITFIFHNLSILPVASQVFSLLLCLQHSAGLDRLKATRNNFWNAFVT